MASPVRGPDRLNATYDWGGLAVQGWIYSHLPWDATILDVGAGWGKYRDLLPDFENVDACEVWLRNIEKERLQERYRNCYWVNVVDLVGGTPVALADYDLVVFGDVLEHLTADDAHRVLGDCWQAVVIVPFLYPQGPEDGNPHERHLQDDLTMQVMEDRYPELRLEGVEVRDGKPFKGFYVKESGWEPNASAGSD